MSDRRRERRPAASVVTALAAALIGLLLAEGIVRLTDADWRFARRIVYYQGTDLASHRPDPDPLLRYRLRPGRTEYPNHAVTVNSLGYRSLERSARKPPGVWRIVVLGGSNVYGFDLEDDQTWPAQLERRLNGTRSRPVEVWNGGACAYVGSQMSRLAEDAVATLRPDLVLLALSNRGLWPFLRESPIEPYFDKAPFLWRVCLRPEDLSFPSWLPMETRLGLLHRARFYRLAVLARAAYEVRKSGGDSDWGRQESEQENVRMVREFVARYRKDVAIGFFVCPAEDPVAYRPYYDRLDVPVLVLSGAGLPPAYSGIHPPATVMTWYAEKLADWLAREKLVP